MGRFFALLFSLFYATSVLSDVPKGIMIDSFATSFNANYPDYYCFSWNTQNEYRQDSNGLPGWVVEGAGRCVVGAGDPQTDSFLEEVQLFFVERGNRFDVTLNRNGKRLSKAVSVPRVNPTRWEDLQQSLRFKSAAAAAKMMTAQDQDAESAFRAFRSLNGQTEFRSQLVKAASVNPGMRSLAFSIYKDDPFPELELAMSRYVNDLLDLGDGRAAMEVAAKLPHGQAVHFAKENINKLGWRSGAHTSSAVNWLSKNNPEELLKLAADTLSTVPEGSAKICDVNYSTGAVMAIEREGHRFKPYWQTDWLGVFEKSYQSAVSGYFSGDREFGCYRFFREVLVDAGSEFAEPDLWRSQTGANWPTEYMRWIFNALKTKPHRRDMFPPSLEADENRVKRQLADLKASIPSSHDTPYKAGVALTQAHLRSPRTFLIEANFGYANQKVNFELVWGTRKQRYREYGQMVEKDVTAWYLKNVQLGAMVATSMAVPVETKNLGLCRVSKFYEEGIIDSEPCTKSIRQCNSGTNDCIIDFIWPSGSTTVVESETQYIYDAFAINGSNAGTTNRMGESLDDCAINFSSGNMFCYLETSQEAQDVAPTTPEVVEESSAVSDEDLAVEDWQSLAPYTLVCPDRKTVLFYDGGLFEERTPSGTHAVQFLRLEREATGAAIEPIDSLVYFQVNDWRMCSVAEIEEHQKAFDDSGLAQD